jgi:hypothetical protein
VVESCEAPYVGGVDNDEELDVGPASGVGLLTSRDIRHFAYMSKKDERIAFGYMKIV